MSLDGISILLQLLIKELNILNVYHINIQQHVLFMFKVKNIIPTAFNQVFLLTNHIYPRRFSGNGFEIGHFNLKLIRFAVGCGGPAIWNNFLVAEIEKSCFI